jgi:uncharacterized protein
MSNEEMSNEERPNEASDAAPDRETTARPSLAPPGSGVGACFSNAHELAVVRQILRRYVPGLEVRVFGSRARGTTKRFADLDLLVFARATIEPRRWALLDEAFAESDLPFKVDLLDSKDVEPSVRDRLLEGSVLIQTAER